MFLDSEQNIFALFISMTQLSNTQHTNLRPFVCENIKGDFPVSWRSDAACYMRRSLKASRCPWGGECVCGGGEWGGKRSEARKSCILFSSELAVPLQTCNDCVWPAEGVR